MLRPEEIKELILEHSPIRKHAIENRRLYEGKLPIYSNKKQDGRNKIGTMFHRKMVNEFTGYFAGKPTTIQHKTSDKIQENIDDIFFDNNIQYLQRQLVSECATAGAVYLMAYQNEREETRFYVIPRENIIIIKDELTGETQYVIRYFYLTDKHNQRLRAELYTPGGLIYYFMEADNGSFVMDYTKENPTAHSFEGIPIVEFSFNRSQISLIDAIKDHAKVYDLILSLAADENEDIRTVYAVLQTNGVNLNDLKTMLGSRVVALNPEDKLDFKSKDPKTEPMEKFLDRLQKLMYESAQIVNMSDENFITAQSGLALQLKTFSMNNLAKGVEDEFKQAYYDLLKLIEPVIAARLNDSSILNDNREPIYKMREFDIQFRRNMPATMVQTAKDLADIKSMDIMDDETILSLMDFVDDPLSVLEKKEIQDQAKMGLDYLDLHEEE